jgi:microcystin-dependent protein
VTASKIPVGEDITNPDRVRIYLGRGAADPGRASMGLAAAPAPGVLTSSFTSLPAIPGTVHPPDPSSNPTAFPASGAPGRMVSSSGGFEVKGDGEGAWPYLQPVGAIEMYAGDTAPEGWLLCQGGTFDSAVYPKLATVVGDKFGTHVGTTYLLPDMRHRMPVGAGSVRPVGSHETNAAAGGAAPGEGDAGRLDHRHTHVVDAHDHGLGAGDTAAVPSGSGGGQRMTGSGVTGNRSPGTNSRGVGDTLNANSAYHPNLGVNFIIKND